MVFYLDDCADDNALVERLVERGFTVHTPRSENLRGANDRAHFEHARQNEWVLVSKNPDDFRVLHKDCVEAGQSHAGVFLIYQYTERRKNMSVDEIVAAIERLLSSNVPLPNQVHVLNHWR
jgi:hypothetical protein